MIHLIMINLKITFKAHKRNEHSCTCLIFPTKTNLYNICKIKLGFKIIKNGILKMVTLKTH